MNNIPLHGELFTINSLYGQRGSSWSLGYHTGIDLGGSDEIYATCNGSVTYTGFTNAYGYHVKIKDSSTGYIHLFAHLSSIKCSKDQPVNRNTLIGIMGATGNATGKHLHYEIRTVDQFKDGVFLDPADYMGVPKAVGQYRYSDYGENPGSSDLPPVVVLPPYSYNIGRQQIPIFLPLN